MTDGPSPPSVAKVKKSASDGGTRNKLYNILQSKVSKLQP